MDLLWIKTVVEDSEKQTTPRALRLDRVELVIE